LDRPFHSGIGGLRPVAMERALRMVDEALRTTQTRFVAPCDSQGNPL
jgi:hypothetical protein